LKPKLEVAKPKLIDLFHINLARDNYDLWLRVLETAVENKTAEMVWKRKSQKIMLALHEILISTSRAKFAIVVDQL